jgi:hypothetical protein
MEDISKLRLVERTFELDKTIAENITLKKGNKILICTTLVIGVVAIGLWLYLLDQEKQKK